MEYSDVDVMSSSFYDSSLDYFYRSSLSPIRPEALPIPLFKLRLYSVSCVRKSV